MCEKIRPGADGSFLCAQVSPTALARCNSRLDRPHACAATWAHALPVVDHKIMLGPVRWRSRPSL